MTPQRLPLLQVGDVLITPDLLTEYFCCDLTACGGACCIEGDAGAPLLLEEVTEIEDALDAAWPHLSASAQAVIDKQGVAYADPDGDLVTSIVGGRDCVFTGYDKDGCCLCALEKVCREGTTAWPKPISCALYPLREKRLSNGLVGLNYHRWNICDGAVKKGRELRLSLYRFLKEPLIRRFGEAWYEELETVAKELLRQ